MNLKSIWEKIIQNLPFYKKLREKYDVLYGEHNELNTEHKQTKAALEEASYSLNRLRAEHSASSQEYNKLHAEYEAKCHSLERLCEEHNTLSQKYDELHTEHTQTTASLETAYLNLNELHTEHSQTIDVFNELKAEHERITATLKVMDRDLNELRAKHDDLNQKDKLISKLLSAKPDKNEKFEIFKELVRKDFMEFANDESSLRDEADVVQKVQGVEKQLEELVAFPHTFTKRSVAIGGGFSSGKSAFVNSFIPRSSDIWIPVDLNATTAIPSFVISNSEVSIKGYSHNGAVVDIDTTLYRRLTHNFIKSLSIDLKAIMPYMAVEVPLHKGLFKNICLIDTPGYDSGGENATEDRKTAIDFLKDRDALIWMINVAKGTIPANDLEFIKKLKLDNLPFYVVLSRADSKSKSELEQILDEVKKRLDNYGIEYMGISVYSARRRKEYLSEKIALHDFLSNQNRRNETLEDKLRKELRDVFTKYKKAIKKDKNAAYKLSEDLNELHLDLNQFGNFSTDSHMSAKRHKLHNKIDDGIGKIEKSKSMIVDIKKLEKQMEQMEEVKKKMLESVDEVFRSLRSQRAESEPDLSSPTKNRKRNQIQKRDHSTSNTKRSTKKRIGTIKDVKYIKRNAKQIEKPDFVNPKLSNSLRRASHLPTVNNRIDVNAKDEEGWIPLHYATATNDRAKAKSLLDHGADVNAKDEGGWTPLHYAAEYNAHTIASLLLDHGATVNARDEERRTPLHYAAEYNARATASLLLDHGATVNVRTRKGWTPLHYAAKKNARATASLLLDHGATVNAKTKEGSTPLRYAVANKAHKTEDLLRRYNAWYS